MRTPEQCEDMEAIRADVNALDREIVRLLGRRLAYVRSAVRFKPDEESIRRPPEPISGSRGDVRSSTAGAGSAVERPDGR